MIAKTSHVCMVTVWIKETVSIVNVTFFSKGQHVLKVSKNIFRLLFQNVILFLCTCYCRKCHKHDFRVYY